MRNLIFVALLSSTALVPGIVKAQEENQQIRQQNGQERPAGEQQVRAIELVSMPVVNDQNRRAGIVAGVVERDQQQYVVIETADDRDMLMVELENVRMQGGQLAVSATSLDNAQPWRDDMQASYTPVPEQEPVTLAAIRQEGQQGMQQAQGSQQAQGAQITVEQQPAQVMVEQQPPQIIVRQAPPTIIVQQPQPEIIVRMPEPQVAVSQQQPQVQIEQPEPEVQTNQAQARVSTQQAQPQVRFERTGEPRVQFQEEQGQPRIRIERMQEGQQQQASRQGTGQQQAGTLRLDQERVRQAFEVGGQQPQGANAQQQQVAASDLAGMQVYNGRGETLGRVDRVLQDPTQRDRHYVLLQTDQSFGFDQNQVILPLERVSMRNNRLVVTGVTESDLQAMQDTGNLSAYPQVAQGEMVNVGGTP